MAKPKILGRGGAALPPIRQVIHIADIHIRRGDLEVCRYTEYEAVLGRFCDQIAELPSVKEGAALIAILGDVFDSKGRIESPAVQMFFQWMERLLTLAPVVLIAGNHDFVQNSPQTPDMVGAMTKPLKESRHPHPMFYLEASGQYVYRNLGFGLVSVKETLKPFNTFGVVDSLPVFPPESALRKVAAVEHTMALFHGSVPQSYPIKWFSDAGYRRALLGDYHLQMLKRSAILAAPAGADGVAATDGGAAGASEIVWGYPGSLIQQNFGEPTFGHGYLLWDLPSGDVTQHHVANDFGMVTMVRRPEGEIMAVLGPKRTIRVADAVSLPEFPMQPKVRVRGRLGDEDAVRATLVKLGEATAFVNTLPLQAGADEGGAAAGAGAEAEAAYDSWDGEGAELVDGADGADGADGVTAGGAAAAGIGAAQREMLADLNSSARWCEYLKATAPELAEEPPEGVEPLETFVRKPETMSVLLSADETAALSAETAAKIKERNATIVKACEEFRAVATRTHSGVYRIVLKHMAWDYAMCYGKGNHYHFAETDGRIVLLNGMNASGKSSFLDVLCIGFFGEPTKSRTSGGRSMSAKMIHDRRPTNDPWMSVKILFEMQSDGGGAGGGAGGGGAATETYEVARFFSKAEKETGASLAKPMQTTVHRVLSADGEKLLVADGVVSVDAWVAKHVGGIDDILMSTIVSQMDNANFFFMKPEEQKMLLDRALHLDSIPAFSRILHESILAHNAIIGRLSTAIDTLREGPGGATGAGGAAGGGAGGGGGAAALGALQTELADMEAKRAAALEKREGLIALVASLGGSADGPEPGPDDAGPSVIKNPKVKLEKALAKRETFSDLSEADRESALMVKGQTWSRREAIVAEMRDLEAADAIGGAPVVGVGGGEAGDAHIGMSERLSGVTGPDAAARVAAMREAIAAHTVAMPVAGWSEAELATREAEIAEWNERGGGEVDPDQLSARLADLSDKASELADAHMALVREPVRKPIGLEPRDADMRKKVTADAIIGDDDIAAAEEKVAGFTARWTEEMRGGVKPRRDRAGRERWAKRHAAWLDEGGDETADELAKRVAEYADFIANAEKKETERRALVDELAEIEALEAETAAMPFNAECWACQKQPMRVLMEKKRVVKTERAKVLARVSKYLAKCDPALGAAAGAGAGGGGAFAEFLERTRADMASVAESLARRRAFEAESAAMEAEAAEWAAAESEWAAEDAWRLRTAKLEAGMEDWKQVAAKLGWMRWRQWSSEETRTRTALEKIRDDVAEDTRALDEYSEMSGVLERCAVERQARSERAAWEAAGAALALRLDAAARDMRWIELAAERADVEAAMNVNMGIFDRLVEWEGCNETIRMLRLAIGREDLRKAGAALEALEAKITGARETLGRLRQEATEREWRATRMAALRAIQARLGERRDRLALIEQKFSGDAKNSDGFKEWVYRNKVIPLLEREVNQFLAVIDPIRLRVEYRGKRLVYTVLDRGNAPTLDNCSGYQKYIVNLAMRAGLSRISAVGQHISALLIDEGFVAMDSVNIQKTRDILRGIMAYCGHRHLVLMSHLDVIRDSADVQVNIARREPFSQIQFGAPYPDLRVRKGTPESSPAREPGAPGAVGEGFAPKKRGRPKKIVAAA